MNSNDKRRSAAIAVLVGYNLPFLLWTIAAVVAAEAGETPWLPCMIRSALGWCPSCGLTRQYAHLLRAGDCPSCWLGILLAGFVANGLWSAVKARRLLLPQ